MDLLKSIFKGDKVIWIIFLFLCLISITEVFSAASTLTYKSGDHWGPITQHSILLMVGAVIVVLVHNIPYKWFQVFPVFLLPISIGLLAFVMLMGFITGDRVNGAARQNAAYLGKLFLFENLLHQSFLTIEETGKGAKRPAFPDMKNLYCASRTYRGQAIRERQTGSAGAGRCLSAPAVGERGLSK